jgi:NTE family protein
VAKTDNFSLVLGGGGVKGLAHIALLKRLDALKAKPSFIVGTSMGAIIGGLYAAGVSGEEIEARVRAHIINPGEKVNDIFKKHKALFKWAKVFSFEKSRGGFLAAEGLFEHLFSEIVDMTFNDLETPFMAVATNYFSGDAIGLADGELLPAIKASMAVPGVFAPVKLGGTLLVDGGLVNNLPCDFAAERGMKIIASDVIGLPEAQDPNTLQIMSGALHIMLEARTQERLKKYPVDYLFKPNTLGIDAFDFIKIASVLQCGDTAAKVASEDLESILISS